MKTSRIFRIFMMALDTLMLAFLRLFRRFTKLETFPASREGVAGREPHAVRHTRPSVLGIEPELSVNGEPCESYERAEKISFAPDGQYSEVPGIVTFRGDSFRSGAAYGTAHITKKKLRILWQRDTGRLAKGYGHGFWTGSGWTGQPLIVRWNEQQKSRMDIIPEKTADPLLTEAVYSTMDGNVYFIDIADGADTRPPMEVGLPFKGSGALDPRGLPLLHLGPGDSGPTEDLYARAYLASLCDRSVLHEYGGRDPFSIRRFCGFDSSPLIHAATDTLIEPSENGILYTMKLNSRFDADGRFSVAPDEIVRLRYKTARSGEDRYWLGMEDSAAAWKNYLYIADNGGNLFCIDLNTMRIIWAQDVADDTNGSPVIAVEEGVPYIYIATSLHWTASRRLKLGDVPIFKINGITGEYVWRRSYFCNTIAGISGGIQATCAIGRAGSDMEGMAIFPVARTPQVRSGLLVALDRATGREIWRTKLSRYAWSSPVDIYDEEGRGYILLPTSGGSLMLIEGKSGRVLDEISLGASMEASPAVFENTAVIGTRGMKIFGVGIE